MRELECWAHTHLSQWRAWSMARVRGVASILRPSSCFGFLRKLYGLSTNVHHGRVAVVSGNVVQLRRGGHASCAFNCQSGFVQDFCSQLVCVIREFRLMY